MGVLVRAVIGLIVVFFTATMVRAGFAASEKVAFQLGSIAISWFHIAALAAGAVAVKFTNNR